MSALELHGKLGIMLATEDQAKLEGIVAFLLSFDDDTRTFEPVEITSVEWKDGNIVVS